MTFPAVVVFFAIVYAILAGRWGSALQRSHELAAKRLGQSYRADSARNPVSEMFRLYALDGWLEQQLALGQLQDDEAARWHRVARNRWWLLLVAVAFSVPALIISLLAGTPGTRIPAVPALPTAIATWVVAAGVSDVLLRGDDLVDRPRVLRVLGLIAALGGFALVAPIILGR